MLKGRKRAESRAGMIVTTVCLPVETHRRLLLAAVEVNAAMTEIAREAFDLWLARHSGRKRKAGGSR